MSADVATHHRVVTCETVRFVVRIAAAAGVNDDDADDVIAGQAAAATQQVLQRASTDASVVSHQEPARCLQHCTGRAQGGRDAGAEICQLAQ